MLTLFFLKIGMVMRREKLIVSYAWNEIDFCKYFSGISATAVKVEITAN